MRKEKAEAPPLPDIYDAVVIGAGSFGAWTAYHLRKFGRTVALLDQYGPANSRASSGDESRILRMGYGPAEIYTRWAQRSRRLWIDLFEQVEQPELFLQTGALWTPPPVIAAQRRRAPRLKNIASRLKISTPPVWSSDIRSSGSTPNE